MAIKINNTTVIDDSYHALNVSKITFADASEQTTAAVGGALGPTVRTANELLHTLYNPSVYSTAASDQFGNSVAISGNYAVVGSPYESSPENFFTGVVYVFDTTTGTLLHTLRDPVNADNDHFGNSVAIDGNYIIIGAVLSESPPNYLLDVGRAYIYDAVSGSLIHTLYDPNAYSTPNADYFGRSVAISGNYAIVGATGEDDASGGGSGKAYIFDVTTGALLHTLDNPNAYSTGTIDYFGSEVAILGNRAVVTATSEDDAGGPSSGKAYVFEVATGTLLYTLDNPNAYSTSASDYFGSAVALNSKYIFVAAYAEDRLAPYTSVGAVYIFDIITGQFIQMLQTPYPYSNTYFGDAIAATDKYLVTSTSNFSGGVVHVYDTSSWEILASLSNPNVYSTSTGDYFGISVAISGNYIISGADQEDSIEGSNAGAAYIFSIAETIEVSGVKEINFANGSTFNASNQIFDTALVQGELVHTLDNPNAYSTSLDDNFANAVAISGNYAIVSAYYEDDAGGSASGKAYIFDVTTGMLVHTLDNPNAYSTSEGDNFGRSVAISGNYAIVGATFEDDASNASSGKAYIFDVTTGMLVHTLDDPNAYGTSASDVFGNPISMDGNYAIVGAPYEDDNSITGLTSGKAYIFDVTTGLLLHTLDNPNPYSTSLGDNFGAAVGISGTYAIVGAYDEDDIGTTSSGRAYIFDVTTGTLVHTLDNPSAYSSGASDFFGYSVAISGNYATVGAHGEDDVSGLVSGKAYIFDVTTGTLVHTLDNPNVYGTSANDYFARGLHMSGNHVIIGAYQEDDTQGLSSGKAYIFDVTTGTLLHTLDNPNAYSTSAYDQFSLSLAISGNYAIVGTNYADDAGGGNSGKAYIFSVTNQTYFDKLTALAQSL